MKIASRSPPPCDGAAHDHDLVVADEAISYLLYIGSIGCVSERA